MQKFSIWLLVIFCLVACDRAYFYTTETNSRINFHQNQDSFIAFGKALDTQPEVVGATNCLSEDCWRIGRNFPYSDDEIDQEANNAFIPHLNNIGLTGYIFFQRGEDGRAWLPDYYGGRTGDFSLTLTYVYWPDPDKVFTNCQNYTPPTEDFYDCFVELENGWMISKWGINQIKLRTCSEKITDCSMAGGTQKSCTPQECAALVSND